MKNKGFTLVEIMIVVAIIALLTVITIPILSRMRLNAEVVRAKAELKSIETAITMYIIDNGLYPTNIRQLQDYVGIGNIETRYELNKNLN